jgi:hypothetical protein
LEVVWESFLVVVAVEFCVGEIVQPAVEDYVDYRYNLGSVVGAEGKIELGLIDVLGAVRGLKGLLGLKF